MRKHIVNLPSLGLGLVQHPDWFHLQELAEVEVSSEDSHHPIESAFSLGQTTGWHADSTGEQSIRLIFNQPQSIQRIHLRFKIGAARTGTRTAMVREQVIR